MFFPGRSVCLTGSVLFLALAAFLVGGGVLAQSNNRATGSATVPAPIEDLLVAQPFELAEGYRWGWPPDEPPVTSGTIIVLRADPSLTVPRQAPTPILYAGDRRVHTLNTGQGSGILIGLVPDATHLAGMPIWFGPARIPGTVDEKTIEADRIAALGAGIRPLSERDVARVSREAVRAPDLATLLREDLAELVLEFVPEERALAAKWRLPEVGDTKGDVVRP